MTLVLAPGGLSSLVTPPAAFGAAETVVLNAKIPAATLQVGSVLHVAAFGTISATTAGTILGRLRCGTAGTTADAQLCATAAIGSATAAVGFHVQGLMTVRTVGATGTVVGHVEVAVGANTQGIAVQSATVTVNTTVDNFLDLTLIGGGTAPSITVVQAAIEVLKP